MFLAHSPYKLGRQHPNISVSNRILRCTFFSLCVTLESMSNVLVDSYLCLGTSVVNKSFESNTEIFVPLFSFA